MSEFRIGGGIESEKTILIAKHRSSSNIGFTNVFLYDKGSVGNTRHDKSSRKCVFIYSLPTY